MMTVAKRSNKMKKSVTFLPYVSVRKFTPISDPSMKEQLYYSQNDLTLIKMRAKFMHLQRQLENKKRNRIRAQQAALDFQRSRVALIAEQKDFGMFDTLSREQTLTPYARLR
mmetsp:Transcript_26296/g.39821  ORF Transcript_26296/g.39821 Transcript_26296/m.39821 type:complete len:112 (-) Transcript_26296:224-559(-)